MPPWKRKRLSPKDPNFQQLVQSIGELTKGSQQLAQKAVTAYAPIVESLIQSQCRDTREIERTLDGLLDFCFDPGILRLDKKLCRHYYGIDPAGTSYYVHAYREMWNTYLKAKS